MLEDEALLRIREGGFTYLLATDQVASIEHRTDGALDVVDDPASLVAAWYRSGADPVPVVRLGRLMRTRAGDWEHAIVLGDGADRVGIAAERVDLLPESERSAIQPFNPAGCATVGGRLITGLCPGLDPECFVLDSGRIQRCLRRVAQG